MHLGPKRLRTRNSAPNLNRLHRLQTHHRPRQQPIQPFVPVGVSTQPRRRTVHHHFKHTANRVTGARNLFHFFFHARFCSLIHAGQHDLVFGSDGNNLIPFRRAIKLHPANADHVAGNLDAQRPQQQLCKCSGRHTPCRLTRRSPLQHIPCIGKVIFQRACQVRMPGPRRSNRLVLGRIACPHRELVFPVLPIAVHDFDRNRRPNGLAVQHA